MIGHLSTFVVSPLSPRLSDTFTYRLQLGQIDIVVVPLCVRIGWSGDGFFHFAYVSFCVVVTRREHLLYAWNLFLRARK
jgi:hypothetical protein